MSQEIFARIAALESELAGYRAKAAPSQADPAADKRQLLQDPIGYMQRKFGLTTEELMHVNRVNLAVAMGDAAPQELRNLAQQGPLIAQQSQIASALESLSRQVQEIVKEKQTVSTAQSLQALVTDKAKYPHLATAVAKNPKLLEQRMAGRSGTAEEIAKVLEDEAALFAESFGVKAEAQTASDDAAKKEAQSEKSKPAPLAGGSIGDVPPLPGPQGGLWSREEDLRVQQELSRKYGFELPTK